MKAWSTYSGIRVPAIPLKLPGRILKDDLIALANRGVTIATSDPTVSDDSDAGFEAGSQWINTSTNSLWMCLDPSVAAAVWRPVYARSEDALILDPSAVSADLAIGELYKLTQQKMLGARLLLIFSRRDPRTLK